MKYSFKEIEEAAVKVIHCCEYKNMLVRIGLDEDGILSESDTKLLGGLLKKLLANFGDGKPEPTLVKPRFAKEPVSA